MANINPNASDEIPHTELDVHEMDGDVICRICGYDIFGSSTVRHGEPSFEVEAIREHEEKERQERRRRRA